MRKRGRDITYEGYKEVQGKEKRTAADIKYLLKCLNIETSGNDVLCRWRLLSWEHRRPVRLVPWGRRVMRRNVLLPATTFAWRIDYEHMRGLMSVPHAVIEARILSHLSDAKDVFSLMYTCKQFFLLCWKHLKQRAVKKFGAKNATPKALSCLAYFEHAKSESRMEYEKDIGMRYTFQKAKTAFYKELLKRNNLAAIFQIPKKEIDAGNLKMNTVISTALSYHRSIEYLCIMDKDVAEKAEARFLREQRPDLVADLNGALAHAGYMCRLTNKLALRNPPEGFNTAGFLNAAEKYCDMITDKSAASIVALLKRNA